MCTKKFLGNKKLKKKEKKEIFKTFFSKIYHFFDGNIILSEIIPRTLLQPYIDCQLQQHNINNVILITGK